MSRQVDDDLSERSRYIIAHKTIIAPRPTPCDRPLKPSTKQQSANKLARPSEGDTPKPVSKTHAFKKRQSKAQRLYDKSRNNLMNSPWLRYQGRQFAPKDIVLPGYKHIPALVDWVYHGAAITSEWLLIWLYNKLSELPDSHINQLDTTTVLQLVGPNNSHLVRWLGDRNRSHRKTSRHFTISSDRNVFADLYEIDLPVLLARLTVSFEQLALLMRVFHVSQDPRKQLLFGFESMLDPTLFRIQNRTLLMYAGVNYKQDPVLQLIEEILQNYLYHRGSRPQIEISLHSEELQPSPDQPTSELIKETSTYLSNCFGLVEAVRKRIPKDLEKAPECQISHTDLRIWIGSVLVDMFGTDSGLNLETPSVLYSQLCDVISSDLKIMILMKKSIAIRIKNFSIDALERDREAEIEAHQLVHQGDGDDGSEEVIPETLPADATVTKPNLASKVSGDVSKHSPLYDIIQERLAYWRRRMDDAIRAEAYSKREYKRTTKPSSHKQPQSPAPDGPVPSLPDEENNNVQSISDMAGQKRSISEVSTIRRSGKSKLADFPPEDSSEQLSEIAEADGPVSQHAKRLRPTKQNSSESEEGQTDKPAATIQQMTVRHGGLPSSSSSMERDEILAQRRPLNNRPALQSSSSSSSSSSRSHGESSDIIM